MNSLSPTTATIIVKDVPDKFKCSSLLEDLIESLPELLEVQVGAQDGSKFLYVGQIAPSNQGRGSIWLELNGSGVPIRFNYFLDNRWNSILELRQTPQWRNGDYLNDKTDLNRLGYVLMDGTNGTTDLTHLFKKTAGSNPVNYSVYAVAFSGVQTLD